MLSQSVTMYKFVARETGTVQYCGDIIITSNIITSFIITSI